MIWSPCCPRDSQESSPTLQLESINSSALSLLNGPNFTSIDNSYMTTGKNITFTIWTFVGKVMSLLFNILYRFVIAFLPRSKRLFIHGCSHSLQWFLEPKKIKSVTALNFFPSICHEEMGLDAMILDLWMLSFKPAFSLCSFTFIKRLFSFSSLSAIRMVSSVYLRLLIFLPAILIPAMLHPAWHFAWCILHIS